MADGGNKTVTAGGGGGASPASSGRISKHTATAAGSSPAPGATAKTQTAGAPRNASGSAQAELTASMPTSTADNLAVPPTRARPTLTKQPSNSLPSTPSVHARQLSDDYRTPPPTTRMPDGMSPRSARSESDSTVRATARAPFLQGCKFETGMAFSRRRIPYSIGGDLLEPVNGVQKTLDPEKKTKLDGDMRDLYDRLLPTQDSDSRRTQLVQKLDKILNERWPGNEIKVHVFGSSGNLLCSNDSDVDICITTTMKALERVCLLAKALADHGMERVVCVPNAKVPIVKIWDPELKLSCDMNVNNTLALENTRMIRTYVRLDARVRPLAMVIKHWTRRRILNDAALGGTLSSYTWICMIIHFLQARSPPILPSLQKRPKQCTVDENGQRSSFADDVEALSTFGEANKESLGELLFQFFRLYGHEIDYENNIISIREGKLLSKQARKWHLMQNNRLCVEEPFNTERNLGNTMDDISFRGVHLEIRRAFDLIAQAKLDEACEEYVFPPQEEKVWVKPPPQPRPVLTRSLSQQGRSTRGNPGGANPRSGTKNRTGSSNRRASSAAAMNKTPSYPSMQPVDRLSGNQIHAQLFHHYQLLQAQEQQLRMHLQERAQQAQLNALSGGQIQPLQSPASAYPLQSGFDALRPMQPIEPGPLSAPLRGGQSPYYPIHLPQQLKSPYMPPNNGQSQSSTNPPSPTMSATPSVSSAGGEVRSSQRMPRSAQINEDSATARSQSQPPSQSGMRQVQRPLRNAPVLTPYPNHQGQLLGATTLQQFQQLYMQAKLQAESQRTKVQSPTSGSPNLGPLIAEYPPNPYYTDPNLPPGLRGGGFEVAAPYFPPGTSHQNRSRRASGSPTLSRQTPRSPSPTRGRLPQNFPYLPSPAQPPPEPARPSSSSSAPQSGKGGSSQQRSGPLIVDGSSHDFSESPTPPESQSFFVPQSDPASSTSGGSLSMPPAPQSSDASPSPRGRSGVGMGNLPNILQFGDFPARATLRNSRAPNANDKGAEKKSAAAPLQAPFNEASNGLGIDIAAESTQPSIRPPTEAPGAPQVQTPPQQAQSTPPKPPHVATDGKANGSEKPAGLLSPVREVRTPSPTITRAGLATQSNPKGANRIPGSSGSPAQKGSRLSTETKPEGDLSISKSNGISESLGEKAPLGGPTKTSTTAVPAPANASAFAPPVQPAPSTSPPVQLQSGGWQQSMSKKAKRNSRKSASVGSVPLDAERKGG